MPQYIYLFLSEVQEVPVTAAAEQEPSLFPIGRLEVLSAFESYNKAVYIAFQIIASMQEIDYKYKQLYKYSKILIPS